MGATREFIPSRHAMGATREFIPSPSRDGRDAGIYPVAQLDSILL